MIRRTSLAVVIALVLAACGSDADEDAGPTATVAPTSTTAAANALTILVTNDDGIGAPGLDALVSALQALPDVEVVVVAPAENQSGSSDKTTPGGAPYAAGQTASGVAGTAVQGFPADTIAAALDELGLEPDLVVSGVNQGQNVGPLAAASGTLGAARTALRRGIPAVASSAGLEALADYQLGASLVVDWIVEHRAEVADGTIGTAGVVSFNVPGCRTGAPKPLVEVPLATAMPDGANPFETADCSLEPAHAPADDVDAMLGGYLAETVVPADL
ncbi:MAG: 5'/3'-nucleotidase SurE [Acidimicrobiales bacterium]